MNIYLSMLLWGLTVVQGIGDRVHDGFVDYALLLIDWRQMKIWESGLDFLKALNLFNIM